MKYLILITMLLVPVLSWARLGETEEQCLTRYGEPVGTATGPLGGKLYIFNKEGINVGTEIFRGKVGSLYFQSADGESLSPLQIAKLLDANREGSQWTELKEISIDTKWSRNDGGAFALYSPLKRHLIVMTSDYREGLQNKETSKMDGF